jgi:hypothetical protein
LDAHLVPDTLNLADRNFFSMDRWLRFAATGAQLAWRVKKGPSTIETLGFTRGGGAVDQAERWRRNGFATWLFTPAVSGWYLKKAPQESRPVPVLADLWPGVAARGRGAQARADSCWVPVANGLRHTTRRAWKGSAPHRS